MILDSFDSAEENFRQRQLIEARNEAGTIMAALEKGKRSPAGAAQTLTKEAHRQNGKVVARGKRRRRLSGDPRAIDALNQGTMRLAELMRIPLYRRPSRARRWTRRIWVKDRTRHIRWPRPSSNRVVGGAGLGGAAL